MTVGEHKASNGEPRGRGRDALEELTAAGSTGQASRGHGETLGGEGRPAHRAAGEVRAAASTLWAALQAESP